MSTARDSNRLTQLEWIHNGLETYKTKWKLPLPDDSVIIYASWVTNIIWYQWNAWDTVLNKIWYQKWWKDPLDDKYYTYYTDKKQQNIEVLGFLENDSATIKETVFRHPEFISGSIIQWYIIKQRIKDSETSSEWRIFLVLPKIYATDYTERTIATFWKKLWILLDTSNNPIQENINLRSSWLDIVTTTWSYTAVFTDKDKVSWTWVVLQVIQWTTIAWSLWNSCKDYLDKSKSLLWKDWVYQIKLSSSIWSFSVYCDMTTDWWGWTLAVKTIKWWATSYLSTNKYYTNSNTELALLENDARKIVANISNVEFYVKHKYDWTTNCEGKLSTPLQWDFDYTNLWAWRFTFKWNDLMCIDMDWNGSFHRGSDLAKETNDRIIFWHCDWIHYVWYWYHWTNIYSSRNACDWISENRNNTELADWTELYIR